MTKEGIWTIENKKETKFLRKRTSKFNFAKSPKKDIQELIHRMKETMKKASGIGLSANQIGLDISFFITQLDGKFYAVFNPEIKKFSEEMTEMEEGCLSVPEIFGTVARPGKIVLEGYDKNGKKLKIKAWGMLARVFQHEVDHLNGVLFIDKAKNLHKYEEISHNKL